MKKYILLMIPLVFFVACETGIPYDENMTIEKVPQDVSENTLVERDDISILLDDKEIQGEPYYDDENTIISATREEFKEDLNPFSNVVTTGGFDVRKIREGKHKGYIRLVFDVYDDSKPAKTAGDYDATHSNSKKDIAVILHGYQKFTAPLPSFPYSSVIEQIHFVQYPKDSGFKFHIKLRKNAEVKIFDLKNPARIVFDIKAI